MRQVKRWRYYCDHCRKSGGAKGHMASHEAGCTANPERQCKVCDLASFDATPLPELIAFLASVGKHHSHDENGDHWHREINADQLKQLRERADGCPCCMFAALRQSKTFLESDLPKFDLKAEMREVWPIVNAARYEGVACYG